MASKFAIYDANYPSENILENCVSQILQCIICASILREPVTCQEREHLFCRDCITKAFQTTFTCPICKEPLTFDTLNEAPRTVTNLLSEFRSFLKIINERHNIIIAGGENEGRILNCAELLSLWNGVWSPLQPMQECRSDASSVLYNDQFIIIGGFVSTLNGTTKSMEKLSLNADKTYQPITWEKFPAELPRRLMGHHTVVYRKRLIVIGGFDDEDEGEYLDSITEISLVPPYTSKLLATMPQRRCYHGITIFDNRIVIIGGRKGIRNGALLRNVVMYNMTENECQELAPLPYPVYAIATVKWGNNNFIIMGGVDMNRNPLNKVLMYNINTQRSYRLPDMNYKRKGCVAAVVGGAVIVMGGQDEREIYLKSVEKFVFSNYSWEELPEMNEARQCATVVTC